jgi:hypothetical protein
MKSRLHSVTRFIAVLLVCLTFLTQAGCVSVGFSPAMKPGSDGTNPSDDPGGGSGGSSVGSIVGIATLAVVGGYLVYKGITGGPEENEDASTTDSSFRPKTVMPGLSQDRSVPFLPPDELKRPADSWGPSAFWSLDVGNTRSSHIPRIFVRGFRGP